jgi:hypothetical protein
MAEMAQIKFVVPARFRGAFAVVEDSAPARREAGDAI